MQTQSAAALVLPTHLFFSWGGGKNGEKSHGSVRGHILYIPLNSRYSTLHVEFLLWEACVAISQINVLPAVFSPHYQSNGVSIRTPILNSFMTIQVTFENYHVNNSNAGLISTYICILTWHKRHKFINLFHFFIVKRHKYNFPRSH